MLKSLLNTQSDSDEKQIFVRKLHKLSYTTTQLKRRNVQRLKALCADPWTAIEELLICCRGYQKFSLPGRLIRTVFLLFSSILLCCLHQGRSMDFCCFVVRCNQRSFLCVFNCVFFVVLLCVLFLCCVLCCLCVFCLSIHRCNRGIRVFFVV